jgi:glutamine cyclotransferase
MKKGRPRNSAPVKTGFMSRFPALFVIFSVVVAAAASVTLLACSPETPTSAQNTNRQRAGAGRAEKMNYEVVASYPHDPTAYTQGLVWFDGGFFESTGLHGQSSLRRVEFPSGRVARKVTLSSDLFGEGLALMNGRLIMLTWTTQRGFVYDSTDFKLLREFTYDTEGWGLTHDGRNLIMSDGSDKLTYLDPENFQAVKKLSVSMDGAPLRNLNELEVIEGEIWANVWMTDMIVRIDPSTGKVVSYLDMKGLLPADQRRDPDDVLNGIAYDAASRRVFIVGKRWPRIFEIKLL